MKRAPGGARPTLARLRQHAIERSLFEPTSLPAAIERLGFVQADPIRAPARAQDLTLRHRVRDYRVGELERRYAELPIEEDFFVNYGFLPRATHALMHPRSPRTVWPPERWAQAHAVLAFVRERGVVHPREVDARFAHGTARNWFGGASKASTQLLDGMHYRGLLRIARRESGVRLYAAREDSGTAPQAQAGLDALVDVVVRKYAPLPARSLAELVSHLRGGVPQWADARRAALLRAHARLAWAEVDGQRWYWPTDEALPQLDAARDEARLLTPFDPVVWDRRRFQAFWGWAYRFEAYTPAPRRKLGYYAMPLLWRDDVVGWANVAVRGGRLLPEVGFFGPRRSDAAFCRALDDELHRLHGFLGLATA